MRPATRDEPMARRWARRMVTIPGVALALGLVTAALPALVVAALLVDLARQGGRRTWVSIRLALFLQAFLVTEVFGLALLGGAWIVTLGSPARRQALTWSIQRLYTGLYLSAVRAIFSVRFETEGEALCAEGGPVVVMVRHASLVDVLVPGAFVANPHRIQLRYVLKRELLMEPCLDVAGQRLPNCFVARDGSSTAEEIARVRALKAGIGARDGVILFPEGTRFSEEKRRRILERLGGDPAARARAKRLHHVLPVRPGGALALLDEEPACDVLFVGHHGLEGSVFIAGIWAGALVGRTVRVKFWRERAASIPAGADARLEWLGACWQRLDDWISAVDASRPGSPTQV